MADPQFANLVDFAHLSYFKQKCDALYATKETVSAIDQRVADLETTAGQPNVIETVKVNNVALTPDANKAVNVSVPTTVAELTDASDYAKVTDLPTKLSDLTNDNDTVQDANYVHTDNNYTTADKNKLADVAANAEVNVLESVKVNGSALTITGKAVDILVAEGTANGTVKVNGSDVAVHGLGTAAFVDTESTVAADAKVPTGSAVQTYVTGLGYQTESDVQALITNALTSAMQYKGTKATKADLPSTGNKTGDLWHVTADGGEYAWDGSEWQEMGSILDLSNYVTFDDISLVSNDQIDTLFA